MLHRRVLASIRAKISHRRLEAESGGSDGGRAHLLSRGVAVIFTASSLLFVACLLLPAKLPHGNLTLKLKGGKHEFSYCEAPMDGEDGILPPGTRTRKLKQIQVVIRHGDRSPITSLTSPSPEFDCKLKDPTMRRVAQLVRERFSVAGVQGKASLEYLTHALLAPTRDPPGKGQDLAAMQGDETRAGPETAFSGDESQACFPGQLTERGLQQQLRNGQYLRDRYGTALGIKDMDKEIYFRSTNYPRTFISGAVLMLSFLAPIVPEHMPVVVQEENNKEALFGRGLIGASRPRNIDPFQSAPEEKGSCRAAFALGAQQEKAFKVAADLDRELFDQLKLSPAVEAVARNLSVADATDPLMGMACHSQELPVKRSLVHLLKQETDRMFCERFAGAEGGREGTRLGMQPFLREVLGRFQSYQDTRLKLALYSAHDTVLSPLLGALDVLDRHCYWPPYASRIVFELWGPPIAKGNSLKADTKAGHLLGSKESEENAVRILYNGNTVSRRSLHCPEYRGKYEGGQGMEEEMLLPLGCLQEYVERMSPRGGSQVPCT